MFFYYYLVSPLKCYMNEMNAYNTLLQNKFELVECVPSKCYGSKCTFCIKSVTQDGVTFRGCGGRYHASYLGLSENGCKAPSRTISKGLAVLFNTDDFRLICGCTGDACNGGSSVKLSTMIQIVITVFMMAVIFA